MNPSKPGKADTSKNRAAHKQPKKQEIPCAVQLEFSLVDPQKPSHPEKVRRPRRS